MLNLLRIIAGRQRAAPVAPVQPVGAYLIAQSKGVGTALTYSVATPAGTGGLLVLAIGNDDSASAPTTDDFILQEQKVFGSDNSILSVYLRVSDGTEGSTIEGTVYGANGWVVLCARLGGVDLDAPIYNSSNVVDDVGGSSPLTLTYGGSSSSEDNSLFLVVSSVDNDDPGVVAFTPPTGYTDAEQGAISYSNCAWSWKALPASGGTGAANGLATGDLNLLGYCSVGIVFSPAPAPVAGIDKLDVTILANSDDPTSADMATAYATAHGIDAGQIVTVSLGDTPYGPTTTQINDARTAIASAGREFTVLAMQVPSRKGGPETGGQSITSAITFGVRDQSLLTESELFNYSGLKPYTDKGVRPSMLLYSSDYIRAGVVLNSGASYYIKQKETGEGYNTPREGQDKTGITVYDCNANATIGEGDGWHECTHLGSTCDTVHTGVTGWPSWEPIACGFMNTPYLTDPGTTVFLEGCYLDHLTSYGGDLPDSYGGQVAMLWEMDRGACATVGTVEEPGGGDATWADIALQFVDVSIFHPLFKANTPVGVACWAAVECPDRTLMMGDLMFRAQFDQ